MDRAEAIKRLEDFVETWDGDPFVQGSVDAFKLAIAALREQEQREWISVKERLPENDTYVNVSTDGVVAQAYWHNDKFYAFTAIGVATVGGVTHWMPLPEPPKEGADHE